MNHELQKAACLKKPQGCIAKIADMDSLADVSR